MERGIRRKSWVRRQVRAMQRRPPETRRRTLPLRPWGSTQSLFFMVFEVPIRLSLTVGFLMEFSPCLLTSTFFPLA